MPLRDFAFWSKSLRGNNDDDNDDVVVVVDDDDDDDGDKLTIIMKWLKVLPWKGSRS